MSFQSDIKAFAMTTGTRMDLVVKKVVFDLYGLVVKRTPVDTGYLRANWQVGINVRPQGIIGDAGRKGKRDRHRASLTNAAKSMGDIRAGGVVYLVNNVPYALQIEFGGSKQAPEGMARISTQQVQARVDRFLGGR